MVLAELFLRESLRVLEASGFDADYVHGDIGWEFWCKEGNPLPQRTIDLIDKHKIALFGAITSKPIDEAKAELSPELPGKGFTYSSPIVGLRQLFDLDIVYVLVNLIKEIRSIFVREEKGTQLTNRS